MRRCIIHIGMHKTGSTSIQWSLEKHRDARFQYASLDIPNHSVAMYSLFSPTPEKHHHNKVERANPAELSRYIAAMRASLDKSVASAKGRTLIVSGEDMSVLPPEALLKLRDYFRARFDEVTVVGYIRPPAGFMSSGFQQRVKSGSVLQIRPEREYRKYRKHFGAFDEIFGRENVQLWKYDPGTFPEGCAVLDFCSRLGIALPARRIVRLNESLARQVVCLLFTYRRLGAKLGFDVMRAPEGQRIGRMLSAVGNDRFRFAPELVKPVLAQNREDIAWMEARLGQSLDEKLGEYQPGDVRGESDLLKPDHGTVRKLRSLLGNAAPQGVKGENPEEVAQLVHAFRQMHATPKAAPGGRKRLIGWAR